MGWWETYDGTVIGDELADAVDSYFKPMLYKFIEKYPQITRNQVLHTLAFCSGYLKLFDENRKLDDNIDKVLQVMSIKQRHNWTSRHRVPPGMNKRVAPNTSLVNVYNPFTGEVT